MKINWGTGIAIALVCFIGFIMYFVVTMLTGKEFEHDLVVEEYYKQELSFQGQLDRETNAKKLEENITIRQDANGIAVHFPDFFDFEKINGKITLYRPSNKVLDFEIPLALSTNEILVPNENLVGGRWNVVVDWTYEGESYFFKKEITY